MGSKLRGGVLESVLVVSGADLDRITARPHGPFYFPVLTRKASRVQITIEAVL